MILIKPTNIKKARTKVAAAINFPQNQSLASNSRAIKKLSTEIIIPVAPNKSSVTKLPITVIPEMLSKCKMSGPDEPRMAKDAQRIATESRRKLIRKITLNNLFAAIFLYISFALLAHNPLINTNISTNLHEKLLVFISLILASIGGLFFNPVPIVPIENILRYRHRV